MTMRPHARLLLLLLLGAFPAMAQGVSALKNHDIDQPIEWEADRSELLGREDIALFLGNVRVVQGGLTLMSDRLHVFYSIDSEGGDPTVNRLDVTGKVVLESASEQATAEWGVYDVKERIITLGGGVVLVRGETRLTGDRLAIDLVSGVTRLDATEAEGEEGRIRGRFVLPPAGEDKGKEDPVEPPQRPDD